MTVQAVWAWTYPAVAGFLLLVFVTMTPGTGPWIGVDIALGVVWAVGTVRVLMMRATFGDGGVQVVNFGRTHDIAVDDIAAIGVGRVAVPSRTAWWYGAAALVLRDGTRISMAASHGTGVGFHAKPTRATVRKFATIEEWATSAGVPVEIEVVDLVFLDRDRWAARVRER